MGKQLPLPKVGDLPVLILFHREHPTDPRLILQIPNDDFTQSETHIIRMDIPEQAAWLGHLPRARDLKCALKMSKHIKFYTDTGFIQEMPDLDEPSRIEAEVARARSIGAMGHGPQRDRAQVAQRRRATVPVSALRRYLGGHTR